MVNANAGRFGGFGAAFAACVLAGAAGTCVAQQHEVVVNNLTGSFSQPLAGGGGQTSVSRTVISESDGDNSYTLTMSGDKIRVEHNGKKVPADRVVKKDGVVQVLDKDGAVDHEFKINQAGGAEAPVPPAVVRVERAPRGAMSVTVGSNPPPVMVGMLMEYVEDEEGLVVQRVFDGLPAAKGGLEEGDVIVEIEGKKVENNESLRDALRSKNAGDSLALSVTRDGAKKDLKLELVKYDQEAMDKARGETGPMTVEGFAAPQAFSWSGPNGLSSVMDPSFRENIRKSVEQALESVRKNSAQDAEKWKGEVIKSLEEALKSVEERSAQVRGRMNTLRSQGNGLGGGRTMIFREMPDQVFEVPGTAVVPPAEGAHAEHIDKLTKALDRLNDRLDQLEKKLENKK
ncbi:MAG: PDZ domain-containing protein [Planctomycetota bacterium]|nr:PDZ domain-containing protein [Planctomycetota bacterium]